MTQTEASVQQDIRLEASRRGSIMWRNNNGACVDETGRHIRYGLANDSVKINKYFKSSDLIGITRVHIQPCHVGRIIGVFTATEVKHGGWIYNVRDLPDTQLTDRELREKAQLAFMQKVVDLGGRACFANNVEDYLKCITG